ncbi:MAG TPA: glycoside hydrolase family 88 protein, partial [Opitutaceae bacterium]|nr:glycoside hydrolase family 88 protein [Opitutaceae bacterium]
MRLPTVLGLVLLIPLVLRPQSEDAGITDAERKNIGEAKPEKREILAVLREVNANQLAHPELDASAAAEPLRHIWLRVTWYTGVVAAWKATGDPSFLEQSLAYGRELHWQVGEDPDGPNRLFPIQLWAELYLAKRDRAMIDPSINWLATPGPLTPAGSKLWYMDAQNAGSPPIPYVDSLYGAPALAMLAKITGNVEYRDTMDAFFDAVTARLFDRESGLYYRDPNF